LAKGEISNISDFKVVAVASQICRPEVDEEEEGNSANPPEEVSVLLDFGNEVIL
jgi:hypothetical protein